MEYREYEKIWKAEERKRDKEEERRECNKDARKKERERRRRQNGKMEGLVTKLTNITVDCLP